MTLPLLIVFRILRIIDFLLGVVILVMVGSIICLRAMQDKEIHLLIFPLVLHGEDLHIKPRSWLMCRVRRS